MKRFRFHSCRVRDDTGSDVAHFYPHQAPDKACIRMISHDSEAHGARNHIVDIHTNDLKRLRDMIDTQLRKMEA